MIGGVTGWSVVKASVRPTHLTGDMSNGRSHLSEDTWKYSVLRGDKNCTDLRRE